MGEIVLESVLTSQIDSINDLNLGINKSWFGEDRSGNTDLLAELISKQSGLEHLNLAANFSSNDATNKILTSIVDHNSKLVTLDLRRSANFETDETTEKLADILCMACFLKKCDIREQQGSRKVKV